MELERERERARDDTYRRKLCRVWVALQRAEHVISRKRGNCLIHLIVSNGMHKSHEVGNYASVHTLVEMESRRSWYMFLNDSNFALTSAPG